MYNTNKKQITMRFIQTIKFFKCFVKIVYCVNKKDYGKWTWIHLWRVLYMCKVQYVHYLILYRCHLVICMSVPARLKPNINILHRDTCKKQMLMYRAISFKCHFKMSFQIIDFSFTKATNVHNSVIVMHVDITRTAV